jgi:DNA-binding NtrC family response regulator
MRQVGKAILEKLGYQVQLSENGRRGLEIFKKDPGAIDLVILDMVMPDMNGRDCLSAMKEIRPDVPVILASGFTREEDIEAMRAEGICSFVHKPYSASVLSQAVWHALHPAAKTTVTVTDREGSEYS